MIGVDSGTGSASFSNTTIIGQVADEASGNLAPVFKTISGETRLQGGANIRTKSIMDLSELVQFVGHVHVDELTKLVGNPTRLQSTGTFTTAEGFSGKINYWKNTAISSGELTVSQGTNVTVEGEGTTIDDLDKITVAGVRDGQRLTLMGQSNYFITLKHGASGGNIYTRDGVDIDFNKNRRVDLEYRESISKWIVL